MLSYLAAGIVLLLLSLIVFAGYKFGALWLQAYAAGADVSFLSLIAMRLRRVDPTVVVTAKIMGTQAGLNIDHQTGIRTDDLEAHLLAGGDVLQVMTAIIAARQAGMDLNFDRAAAVDLAGRNVLEAVQTSIMPRVIDCPESQQGVKSWLSAVAKDGIELRVRVLVTVRTCLDQLIGGATEQTIIARVGQGIISTIGSADSYGSVLAAPDQISQGVLVRGLDTNTAFEIVSIDIARIDIGENIGARLQSEQAEAETRMARAAAQSRKANAIALGQEMVAMVARCQADLLLAEAAIPPALAMAFRTGNLGDDQDDSPMHPALRIHRPAG